MARGRHFNPTDSVLRIMESGTRAQIEAILPTAREERLNFLQGVVVYNQVLSDPLFNYVAHWNNNLDVLELFLREGVDINCQNSNGNTALYNAAYFGYLDKIKFLVEHRADINLKSNSSISPVEQAAYMYNPALPERSDIVTKVVAYLAKQGAKGNIENPVMAEIYNKISTKAGIAAAGALFASTPKSKHVPEPVGRMIGEFLGRSSSLNLIRVNKATHKAAKAEKVKENKESHPEAHRKNSMGK